MIYVFIFLLFLISSLSDCSYSWLLCNLYLFVVIFDCLVNLK